jgi:2-dehydropantoate 2-reductase
LEQSLHCQKWGALARHFNFQEDLVRLKICIYGAGGIGSYLAACLSRSNGNHSPDEISLIARGEHLTAIRHNGLTVQCATAEPWRVDVHATDDPTTLGPQDIVFLCVKGPALPEVLPGLKSLLGEKTKVVTAMNGFPWWYFHGLDETLSTLGLSLVDPQGILSSALPSERIIGASVYMACERIAPGVVHHAFPNRLVLGEPQSGSGGHYLEALSQRLVDAGLKVGLTDNIRQEIWHKIRFNASINPISALTGADTRSILTDPGMRPVIHGVVAECRALASSLGLALTPYSDDQLDLLADLCGPHKTSMLQDLEHGRPLELDHLLGVLCMMGEPLGVSTPILTSLFQLVRLRATQAGSSPKLNP